MSLFCSRFHGFFLTIGLFLAPASGFAANPAPQPADSTLSAVARLSQVGPQEKALAAQSGTWDVTASLWPAPTGGPKVTHGLVAERKMIGTYLQEVMRPAPDSKTPDFQRIDYLSFDRVEGRWKYVSMDTRFPVSIMPAVGSGLSELQSPVVVHFAAQAFVGFGNEVEGRFMMSDMTISSPDPDHLIKEQHVNFADGSGKSWLFARYEYVRRK